MANPTTGSETVLFNIDGSLAGIRTQLAEVSKLSGQAGKNMAAGIAGQLNALQTQLAKATAATRGLGTASGRAGGDITNLVRQLNDVGIQAAAGTPPLMILTQQGEQLAFALREAGGASGVLSAVSKSLSGSLGAVAIGAAAVATAVGAGYVAYRAWNEDSERAAQVASLVKTAHEGLEPVLRQTEAATIDLRVAMGWLTDEEGKLAANGAATFKQIASDTGALQEQIRKLQEQQASFYSQWIDFGTSLPVIGAVVDAVTESTGEQQAAIGGLTKELHGQIAAEKHLRELKDLTISKAAMDKEAEEAAAEAKRRSAEAARKLADELERQRKAYLALVDAMDEETAAQVEGRAAAEDLRAMSHAATESTLSDIDKVIDKRDDELKRALATYQDGVKAAGANDATLLALDEAYWDARIDITTAANVELAKLEQKRRDDQKKEDDKAAKAQLAAFQSALSMASQLSSYVASSTGESYSYIVDNLAKTQAYAQQVDEYLTDSQREELDKRMDAQKKAATEAFRMNQAAQFATAAINGISAAVAAWNAGMQSAPGPFALVTAGAFTAASVLATGAQLAAIASQQPAFHSGGLAPDERMYRMIPGEMAVSKQGVSAAGGREAFDRMNAGVSTGGGTIYAVTSYRHTNQVARYEADRLARNSPTMQEISRGRTPGVRSL